LPWTEVVPCLSARSSPSIFQLRLGREGRWVRIVHNPSPLGCDGACYQRSAASIPRITSYSHFSGIVFCPGDMKQLRYDKVNNLLGTTKGFRSRAGKEPRISLP